MYNSQYYTCEQIDQRLLQGYIDDYNNQTGQSLTKEQFLTKLSNSFVKETVIDNTAINIGYFVCDTAAGTAAKVLIAAGYELFQGGSIKVKFTNRNTAGSATLNINSKGAKALYYGGKLVSASNSWDNGEVVEIYYDGTSYYANNVEGNFKDGIFDISVYNNNATYASLAEALGTNGDHIPPIFRKGGMQIKYVSTSDNKYVQYRYMETVTTATTFTNVANWQGVDNKPTAGSKNFVESSGLYSEFFDINGKLDGFKPLNLPITLRNLPVRYDGSEQSDTNFKGYIVDLSIYPKYSRIDFYGDGFNDNTVPNRIIPAVFKDENGNILKYVEGISPKIYSSEIPTGAVLIECSYNLTYPTPTSVTIYSQEDEGLIEKVSDLSTQVDANTGEIETMQEDLSELEDINPIDTYYHSPLNLLNYNDPNFATNKTINSSGELTDSDSYNTSPYIRVEYGKKYALVSSGVVRLCRRYAYYDSNKEFISRVEYGEIIEITNQEAVFIRVASGTAYMRTNFGMFIEVTNPEEIPYTYRPYFEPYSVNALKPEYVPTFGSFRANGTLQTGERLSTPVVHVTKNMLLTAVVNGICSDVKIGVSSSPTADGDYTRYIRLTATEVDVCDSDGTSISGYPKLHGLSLGNRCAVKLTKGITRTSAILQITNEYGDIFDDTPDWPIRVGGAFIENNGEVTINADITFIPKDINKDVWLLGGSYYSLGDPNRWIYYAIHNDDYNWLLDAKPGIGIGGTKEDLKNLLSLGCKPKYALIHAGANGGLIDTENSINETWLMHMQDILDICRENNITPVVFTVPNTPTRYNVKKNEWLRSSGIRLVDMNEALGCDSDFYWKGWGTDNALLSGDQVHPTIRGAKVIASCVYRDFPEIATNGK